MLLSRNLIQNGSLARRLAWLAATVVLGVLGMTTDRVAADEVYRLDNGMQIILKEKHSSPMVSCMVFVRSGSKYESKYENGITHFLEHLLFDGTATKTRNELDKSIDNLGGYINAFTRKDLTAYLVLVPSQYIEYAMTEEADMLFNSVFPEDEMAKERKVVISEINGALDNPDAPAEEFFTAKAYGNTDYGRPVLGYKAFIENLPRQAVIDYWKRYYTPDRMITLVIGDFKSDSMRAVVQRVFGGYGSSQADSANTADTAKAGPLETRRRAIEERRREGVLEGQVRYDTVANVPETYVRFSIEGPKVTADDYLAFDLLSQYLNLDAISPLQEALTQGTLDPALATEASVSLDTRAEFTRLEIDVVSDDPDNADSIVSRTKAVLASLSEDPPSEKTIDGIKTDGRCQTIYLAEKLHYYGFMIAPLLMSAGWDFVQQYPERLSEVTQGECIAAAKKWLSDPKYVLTVVRPADSTQTPYEPQGPAPDSIVAYFDSTTFPTYDLVTDRTITYPNVDSVPLTISDNSTYLKTTLDNGLTVIVKSNDESDVFAVNILGKNRTASEPPEETGITDFVNRCLEKGTLTRNATQLSEDLTAIGADITLYDNPWIPYDDRYTQRSFSFIKFETIEEYAEKGFDLLADIVLHPRFDSAAVEQVRQQMLGLIKRNATVPGEVAENLFYSTYFEGTPFAKTVVGTEKSISGIDVTDLHRYHRSFYAPNNMILSIVTSHDTADVMSWVHGAFGDLPADTSLVTRPVEPPLVIATRSEHTSLPSQEIAIYAGGRLPGADSDETTDLSVASRILSSRLFDNLREREGLAYSTGASAYFDRTFGWYFLSIRTASGNGERALSGLRLQAEKLAFDGPTRAEVRTARNQVWGHLMSAKLSRINQAYYLGLDEFLGRQLPYDPLLLKKLGDVSAYTVRAVSSKYIRPGTWVICSAGKR